ncbi:MULTISPECIES: YjcZ family sporulation protein [Paenibacillus]
MSGVDCKDGGYGGGYPGSIFTSTGTILVLFILLVIVSRAFI